MFGANNCPVAKTSTRTGAGLGVQGRAYATLNDAEARHLKEKQMDTYVGLINTWKGNLRKPHWEASLVLCAALSINGALAACLYRSQRGISEEFLISSGACPQVTPHHHTKGRSIIVEVEDGRR